MRLRYAARSWPGRVRPALYAGAAALLVAACASPEPVVTKLDPPAGTPPSAARSAPAEPSLTLAAAAAQARIVAAERPLECVAYARAVSGIALRGNAGTWWRAAAGQYARGARPQPGAVLVMKPTGRSAGHLAVVRQILGPRLIVADHANWLNRGRIHEGTPIADVSPAGDWSVVRVWYIPGGVWGRSTYAAYGFVYRQPMTVAGNAVK